jgi:hypothetical protein
LPIQTWLFRYQGGGPNVGAFPSNPQPSPGSINRYRNAWAKEPTIGSSGGSLYAVWSETGQPFDQSNAFCPHIYVSQFQGGTWSPIGSSYSSVSSDYAEAHAPALKVIGNTPWVSWYESNKAGDTARVMAKSWDGSAWRGGPVALVGNSAYQGRSELADVAGVPHMALLEVNNDSWPQRVFAYVRWWNGGSWVLKGTGPLNRSAGSGTTAGSISIASNGSNPYIAWTEYSEDETTENDTNPQVYVAYWDGSQWSAVGGSLNVNVANWAYDVAIACLGGQPYVAWTERSQAGNSQLYVKTWNGKSWVLVRVPGNAVSMSWAFRPSLIADPGTNTLYVAWVEQKNPGERAQAYVARYNAGVWTALGGSINADSIRGSAQRISLAIFAGQPVVSWGEVNLGALRQVYAKKWSGVDWLSLI